ncbi:hypothetical protein F5Y06DRAFT_157963 [Hypoxylon sp. FL0890]|nr:hypothetical protein F5Y06DRAFT_157963 [Hypoxylon sp. FL0890]
MEHGDTRANNKRVSILYFVASKFSNACANPELRFCTVTFGIFAMEASNNAPLRASCDRCRAQKLRCVPSSSTDATAPCLRCLRLKTPVLCTFSQRLQMRRSRKNTSDSDSESRSIPRKEKSTSSLPGMSTFVLPGPPSPETQLRLPSPPAKDKQCGSGTDSDTTMITPDQEISDFWSHEGNVLQIDTPPEPVDGAAGTLPGYYNFDMANLDMPEFLYEIMGAPDSIPAEMDLKSDIDKLGDENPLNPLVDLSGLLSEMAHCGSRLVKLPDSDRDNYPIGDAVLISQRFYTILFSYASTDPSVCLQHQDMPTNLLIISCYMMLTGIYSSVFGYLMEHILKMREAHRLTHSEPSLSLHYPLMGDMHAYRGLSLSQLRPVCICGGWDPEKKVVSMLLNSLGGAEELLGLPPDARVVPQGTQTQGGEGSGSISSPEEDREEKRTVGLFGERLVLASSHGHLYKNLKEQAQSLREKVAEVSQLLA